MKNRRRHETAEIHHRGHRENAMIIKQKTGHRVITKKVR